MTAPLVTVGVGSSMEKFTAGPPMFSTPISRDITSQPATGITYDVSSRNSWPARTISARLRSRGTDGLARMSLTTSCMECRLSKMIAASGNRFANSGAMAAVIGIWYGRVRVGSFNICQNRATVARTPAWRASLVVPTSNGSYSPTWNQ